MHDYGFEDEDPFEFMMEKRSNQGSEVLVLLLIVYSGFVFLRGHPVFASFVRLSRGVYGRLTDRLRERAGGLK